LGHSVDHRWLFEGAPGLYLVLRADPSFEVVAVSNAYLAATLTRRESVIGRGLFEIFPDDPNDPAATGVQNLKASLRRVLAEKVADSMAVQKYSIARPDGTFEERHWSPRNFPLFDDAGALSVIIHQVEDVTHYVRSAGRLEAEILARSNELQLANAQLRELTEARGKALGEMESRFRQAQKMEAVGQLAGGVAHDFNNLLTVILSCAELVRVALPPEHQSLTDLADISAAAERAAALTRQLLAFSRKHVINPELIDLNEVIGRSTTMLRRLVGAGITLEALPGRDLDAVLVDRALIEQVLMNLVVNARDAISNGGTITIETANMQLGEGGVLGARPGGYVMLAVSDTGCGIDDATRARLFEPFFTTKGVGRGTGLGLAMVHGVVRECGGDIHVYSAKGKGTTFKVYLPAHVAQRAMPAPVRPTVPAPTPTETVLLVEDELGVRTVARRMLERGGYRVIDAADPAQGLEIARGNTPFQAVLTDVVMPGTDGPSFIAQLLALPHRQRTRVVFMSGYTAGTLVHQNALSADAQFVQKPFMPAQLLAAMRAALS